jgi:hypothetical protein
MIKKACIYLLISLLLAAFIVGGVWYGSYRAGLKPRLVKTLPVQECQGLEFGPYLPLATGNDVDRMCRGNQGSTGPFFALRGRKAVRFVPKRFHSVYGTLETSEGDNNSVYFYQYNARYKQILF